MNTDPRLSDYFRDPKQKNLMCQLLAFPSDEGVKLNGGRPGAAAAPEAIWQQLLKLTPHPRFFPDHSRVLKETGSLSIVPCSGKLSDDQNKLGEVVSDLVQKSCIPIILGGGHETAFGQFLGYVKCGKPVHIINIDAHTDVRPLKNGKPHSGSPFFQAVNHPSKICKSYSVAGLNPSSVSEPHYQFVKDHGLALFEQEARLSKIFEHIHLMHPDNIMATMDMDALNQSVAPGVSAPNSSGLTVDQWLEFAFQLGKDPKVSSFDLSEVNPIYDRDHQTVKLAARTIWAFLLGVGHRMA